MWLIYVLSDNPQSNMSQFWKQKNLDSLCSSGSLLYLQLDQPDSVQIAIYTQWLKSHRKY